MVPTVERLCAAAQGLLAGPPGEVSIRAIAKAAGVNSAAIGYHFGGLDGLLAEAQLRAGIGLSEAVRTAEGLDRGGALDGAVAGLLMGEARLLRAAFAPVRYGAGAAIPGMVAEAIASRLPASEDRAMRARRILAWAVFRVLVEGADGPGPEDGVAAVMPAYAGPEPVARPVVAVQPRRRSEFID